MAAARASSSPAANTATSIVTIANRAVGDSLGLIPASLGARTYNDRPISHALDDARAAAVAAMTADTAANRACRNTVVILITSGKDDGNPRIPPRTIPRASRRRSRP